MARKSRHRNRADATSGDLSPLLRRARLALNGARTAEAGALARQALAEDPGDARAMHLLGQIALREGAAGQACQLLLEAATRRPQDAAIRVDLGDASRLAGRPEPALQAYVAATDIAPSDARAWTGRGCACMSLGRREEGVEAFRRAVALAPDGGEAAMHLATAAHEVGDLDLAESALRRAARCKDTALAAQLGLGGIALSRADAAAARAAFQAALRIAPRQSRALLGLAMSDERAGDTGAALRGYRALVATDASDLAAWEGVERTASVLRDHDERVRAARHLFETEPDRPVRRVALVKALAASERWAEAERLCREGLAAGEEVDLLVQLGYLCALRGDTRAARETLERARVLAPANAEAASRLGEVLMQSGELDAAAACFRETLELVPGHDLAWENLALLPSRLHRSDDVETLRALLAGHPRAGLAAATLRFALATLLDAAGEHESASEFFDMANAKVRELVPWDARAHARLVEDLLAVDAGLVARLAAGGHPSEAPLFIIGMPRSGTTLLEQMLGCHPQVHAAGEVLFFGRVRIDLGGRSYPASLGDVDAASLVDLGRRYLEMVTPSGAAPTRITDKLPANFLRVPLIAAVFPNARFVHLRRNAEDVCLSVYRQNFAVPEGNAWAYSLADIVACHASYARLMERWGQMLGERLLEVEYEQLVRSPEAELRRVLAHAGLPWDPLCLEFADSRRAVATASVAQVREPLHDRNVGRAERYPRLLRQLRELRRVVSDERRTDSDADSR